MLQFTGYRPVIHKGTSLHIVIKTAEIEIGRAYRRNKIIANDTLAVQETFGIKINLYTHFKQVAEI